MIQVPLRQRFSTGGSWPKIWSWRCYLLTTTTNFLKYRQAKLKSLTGCVWPPRVRSLPAPQLDRTMPPLTMLQVVWLYFFFFALEPHCSPRLQTRTSACTTPGGGASTCSGRWRLATWAGASWTSALPLMHSTCSTPAGPATVRPPEKRHQSFSYGSQQTTMLFLFCLAAKCLVRKPWKVLELYLYIHVCVYSIYTY